MTRGRPLGALQPGDPDQIGPYLIRARVGAGGMGVVYLAEAANGRSVAIKVIQKALANDQMFRDRFRREVAAARRVRSRVTVSVLDADADSENPWVAFEYVEGPNLQDVVEAGIPRLSAAIGILSGIAEALVAIHQVGIIHRDLKPSNVLCPPDGVKVIDFGIAAALDTSHLTRTGLMGTPAWLSPEQITGQPLTPAVDVFAWGCVSLYTLTGRLAFGGGGEDSPPVLIYRVVNAEPDLSDIPDELLEPISAALAKQPDDRPSINEILRMMLPGRRLDSQSNPRLMGGSATGTPGTPGAQGGPGSSGAITPAAAAAVAASLGAPGWQGSGGGPSPTNPGGPSWPGSPTGPPTGPGTGGPSGPSAQMPPGGSGWPPQGPTPPGPGGPGGSGGPSWPPPPPPPPPPPFNTPPGGAQGWGGTPAGGTVPVAPGWPGAPPPGGPGGSGWQAPPSPPGWVPPGPPPKKSRTGLLIGGGVAVVAIIAIIASSSGKSPKTPPTTLGTIAAPTTDTTLKPSTTVTTPQGVTPLAQLLPSDVDAAASCSHNNSPPAGLVGLTNALICTPKDLTGGEVFAFQFDNSTDYAASLAALNKFKGFDPATAGSTCPPGADSQDSIGWHNNTFPSRSGQVLECLSVGTNNSQPDYIWTYPTENTVMDAQAAENSTFAALDAWWTKDAPPP